GFEFLHHLRQTEAGRAIPVIVVTAMELSAQDRALLEASAQSVLRKAGCGREELITETARTIWQHLKERAEQRPTILAVDDDPTVVDLLQRALSRQGYRVIGCEHPREAVRVA